MTNRRRREREREPFRYLGLFNWRLVIALDCISKNEVLQDKQKAPMVRGLYPVPPCLCRVCAFFLVTCSCNLCPFVPPHAVNEGQGAGNRMQVCSVSAYPKLCCANRALFSLSFLHTDVVLPIDVVEGKSRVVVHLTNQIVDHAVTCPLCRETMKRERGQC